LRSWRPLSLLALGLTTAWQPATTEAEPFDPTLPGPIVLGEPAGVAPSDRITRTRTGRTSVPLPSSLEELGRDQIGPFIYPPVVDARQSATFATLGSEVVTLDLTCFGRSPQARESQAPESQTPQQAPCKPRPPVRARLGASPAVHPPVLLSNGRVAVLTGTPALVFLTERGEIEEAVPLPRVGFPGTPTHGDASVSLVATTDGGIVVTAHRTALEIDSSGRTLSKTTLPERLATPLLPFEDGFLALLESGAVHLVRPPLAPTKLGVMSIPLPRTGMLVDGALVAGSASQRLLAFDPRSRVTLSRAADLPLGSLQRGAAAGDDASLWLSSPDGQLLHVKRDGGVVVSAAGERGFAPGRSGSEELFGLGHLPPVVDGAGRVAFLRGAGRLGLLSGDSIEATNERSCAVHVAMIPLPGERLLLGCRDGSLYVLGSPTGGAAPPAAQADGALRSAPRSSPSQSKP
jgi:hypothetical protein